jgi:hypothetical protein
VSTLYSVSSDNADIAGFETAACPTTTSERRDQLLNFAIVGGGRKCF